MHRLTIWTLATVLVAGIAADGAEGANRIVGTPKPDSITGTGRDDIIDALAGDDSVRGSGGDDTIYGRRGADRLKGDDGDDALKGNGGNDVLQGGVGNDTVDGHAGNDIIRGGVGDDVLNGDNGNDTIRGDGGSDTIEGGPGKDVLAGGSGPDVFVYSSQKHGRDQILDYSTAQKDSLQLDDALLGGATRFKTRASNTNVSVFTTASGEFAPLTTLKNTLVPIDVWYGDRQTFGTPGEAQRWVNILGSVSMKGITSLTYSLNGGVPEALRPGPDGVRLQNRGDFNVELDYADLDPSPADDTVRIEARYLSGETFVRNVTIAYEGGQSWPEAYEIDWTDVTNLQEVIQVVDGNWAFGDQGVRPAQTGYDRLLVIGDADWDSYTVRTTFIVHSWDSPVEGRALWFGSQWGGHTDNPDAGGIPHVGYIPLTTYMIQPDVVVVRPSEFFNDEIPANETFGVGADIAAGQEYNVLIRNQRVATDTNLADGLDRTYSIKIWPKGTPEPSTFLISRTMVDQEPFGAFCIFPHYVDATIGDVTVTPIRNAGAS
jgi:hypothetical protein